MVFEYVGFSVEDLLHHSIHPQEHEIAYIDSWVSPTSHPCPHVEFPPEDASEVWTDLQTGHSDERSLPTAVDQALSQHGLELNDITENLNAGNKESARQKRRRRRYLLALVKANQRERASGVDEKTADDDEETVVEDGKAD